MHVKHTHIYTYRNYVKILKILAFQALFFYDVWSDSIKKRHGELGGNRSRPRCGFKCVTC